MKVLQINAVYHIHSTGRLVYELHHYYIKEGIDSLVAYSSSDGIGDTGLYQIGTVYDKKLHAALSRIIGLQGYFSVFSTKRLLRFIEKSKPDVVHLHNLHSNYIHLPMLLKYLAKYDIPTVITLHDCWFYTGKCFHYTAHECDKWKTGCNHCSYWRLFNGYYFFDRSFKMWKDMKRYFLAIPSLGGIGVSEWITSEAKQTFLNQAKICKRIYNWIDLETFKPTQSEVLSEFDNQFKILGVATEWADSKGLSDILYLAKKLPEDCIIILVGNIMEKDKQRLPHNVISVGRITPAENLAKYYAAADVFINFSKEESFGLVTAEALACGTPAIVYDSTANGELVGNLCGYKVTSLEGELLQKILLIREKGKNCYSPHCRKFAQTNFDAVTNMKEIRNVYEQLTTS